MYSLTQIQNMWVWPAFRQKQDSYTKIPKAYGKEKQLQDKGKSPKCRPPDIPTRSSKKRRYRAATVCFEVFTADITCTSIGKSLSYGATSDLRRLRKVKLSLYRPGQAQGVSRRFRLSQFLETRHMKVARLSALSTGRV